MTMKFSKGEIHQIFPGLDRLIETPITNTKRKFTELNNNTKEEIDMNENTPEVINGIVMPTESELVELQKKVREELRKEAFEKIVIACAGGPVDKPIKKMMQEVNKNEYDAERMHKETPGFVFQVFFTVEALFSTGETAKVCEVAALPFRTAAPYLQGSDVDGLIALYREEFLEIYEKNRKEMNKRLGVLEIAFLVEQNVTVSIDSVSRFVQNELKTGKKPDLNGKQERQDIAKDFQKLADFFADPDL